MLARMPADLMAKMQAQGIDPAEASFGGPRRRGWSGTIEFLPNGVVRSVTTAEAPTEDGHWTAERQQLRVEVDDAEDWRPWSAMSRATGSRSSRSLKEAASGTDFMKDMTFPLVRRH